MTAQEHKHIKTEVRQEVSFADMLRVVTACICDAIGLSARMPPLAVNRDMAQIGAPYQCHCTQGAACKVKSAGVPQAACWTTAS